MVSLFQETAIAGISYVLPKEKIPSLALEEHIQSTLTRLQLPRGIIEGLTGIRERRFWEPGLKPSQAATMAAERVLADTGIDKNRIGCLINTSVCRDYLEPSVASLVHGNLKMPAHCLNFDLSNACLGFLNGMTQVSLLIETGQIEYGLVVAGEGSREIVEKTIERLRLPQVTKEIFFENFATLTLGSGAAAILLGNKKLCGQGHFLKGAIQLAASEYNHLTIGDRDFMRTDSIGLLNAGVALAKKAWLIASARLPRWQDETIDIYAPHQVSLPHMEAIRKALGLSSSKIFLNLQTLGNIGPAAIPITLAMAFESGRLQPGHHAALLGIGSGLNCAGMSIIW